MAKSSKTIFRITFQGIDAMEMLYANKVDVSGFFPFVKVEGLLVPPDLEDSFERQISRRAYDRHKGQPSLKVLHQHVRMIEEIHRARVMSEDANVE